MESALDESLLVYLSSIIEDERIVVILRSYAQLAVLFTMAAKTDLSIVADVVVGPKSVKEREVPSTPTAPIVCILLCMTM